MHIRKRNNLYIKENDACDKEGSLKEKNIDRIIKTLRWIR